MRSSFLSLALLVAGCGDSGSTRTTTSVTADASPSATIDASPTASVDAAVTPDDLGAQARKPAVATPEDLALPPDLPATPDLAPTAPRDLAVANVPPSDGGIYVQPPSNDPIVSHAAPTAFSA
jgi:hypothetical protein